LLWIVKIPRLSSGLRTAIAIELTSRGYQVEVPQYRPPQCRLHPNAELRCTFREDSLQRRFIRGECSICHRHVATLPNIEPYLRQAEANSSPTALLDVLISLDETGNTLASHGRTVQVDGDLTQQQRGLLRQCGPSLARMIGRGRRV
jgi:hypothetical protein